jgi:hypothetical protein
VDETVQVVDSVPPFAFDWDTRAVSNGTHTLQAVAYDIAGNAGSSSIVTVTVSNSSTETLTFTPTSDATIKKKYPTTNYGVSTKVEVDNSPVTQYLITFTVSGVGTRSVTGAKLRLWNVNASNRGGDFHVGNVAWNERTVTWNTAPTYDAATIASLGSVARNIWVEVDLTSLITGDGTYSFRVTSPSSDGADYTSREGSSASRPQLVVTVA